MTIEGAKQILNKRRELVKGATAFQRYRGKFAVDAYLSLGIFPYLREER